MDGQPSFRTRARVINQLGEQLIKNESIALLELIKNSYDADASKCDVKMFNPESADEGKIIIIDDGEGMDFEILTNVWLEIGTSYKEDLLSSNTNKRSKIYGRRRLGEKGIGRLGAHRLGKEIELITRKEGKKEYVLNINWEKISETKYIENLPVQIEERDPVVFKGGSGTKIIIKRLRVPWTRNLARECARSIMSLNSPFDSIESFRVSFKIADSSWLDGILNFSDIEQYKLFSFDVTMEGNEIIDFNYEFTPWDTMDKLKPRKVTLNNKEIQSLTRMQYKDGRNYIDIDLNKHRIGTICFKGVIFDRDARTLDLGVQDKKGLKRYLDTNGGIRVFRDNMRVLDYGEPGNDWLDLGGRRVNMPTKRISNNIILGSVHLDLSESEDLREKANREGFVENDAYREFRKALQYVIEKIESLRKTDKDLLRKYYGPKKTSEPVVTSITELKEVVEQNIKSESVKSEINRYLERIENEYDSITNSLIRSAGAGLNLIIVIHQIEKIIKEIKGMIQERISFEILEERVKILSSLVEGYSILIKKSEKKVRNIKNLIEQSIFNMQFRLEAHKIQIEPAFRSRVKNIEAVCSEDHVLNALMNLFDNSIWWLGYSKTQSPTIYIDLSDQLPGFISIVFADNGPGFSKPTDEIIKPFVTDKPGGMGIGLHLTHQIMVSLGGKLIFPEMEIYDIPEKFKNGAKIALAFKSGDSEK